MIVLSATDITVSFGTRVILSHVSFSLQDNDRMGLVGVNGCGKSTLFRVLMGELAPDSGAVYLSSGKSIGILRQNDAFLEDQTGGYNGGDNALSFLLAGFPELLETEGKLLEMEEILHAGGGTAELNAAYDDLRRQFERAGGLEFRSRAAGILTRMGFDSEAMHRPLSTLSGGQRTRLALCRQLCREPDVLLLDEPTNHLDIETLGWLENFLSQYIIKISKRRLQGRKHTLPNNALSTASEISSRRNPASNSLPKWTSWKDRARRPKPSGCDSEKRLPAVARYWKQRGFPCPSAPERCSEM